MHHDVAIAPAALLPVVLVFVGFVGYCLYDILAAKQVRYLPKWAWMAICILSIPLGGVMYLLVGRDNNA